MTVKVHLEQQISELKEYISNFADRDEIELIYNGMLVNDDQTFYDSDITDHTRLHFVEQFRSGCSNFYFANLKN